MPNIEVRVLPLGADSGRAFVPFVIYNFVAVDSPTTVLIEAPEADLYLASDSDVDAYDRIFLQLAAISLGGSKAIDYLGELPEIVRNVRSSWVI
jgi:hypothetical protein